MDLMEGLWYEIQKGSGQPWNTCEEENTGLPIDDINTNRPGEEDELRCSFASTSQRCDADQTF